VQAGSHRLDEGRGALMQSPLDKNEGRRRGEQRRDKGIVFASVRKHRNRWRDTVAIIDAMLRNPTGEATTDDTVTNFGAVYKDRGAWRGAVVRDLAQMRLIADTGRSILSCRESRHRARIVVWRAVDPKALAEYRLELLALLDTYPEPPDDPPPAGASTDPHDRGPAPNEKGDAVAAASPENQTAAVNGGSTYEPA